ncbi:hypothetical protein BOTBODRAFT_133128 [Botryobasidium botryosum FD-172 SS1]|uniref:Major facilitator superfamily (MFS) profile domain-containing protein n=1 Tax=Botryobasidium botryosum (strain FD-172 SS1) TaxID=930990 RepID=A0A067MED4_BOTB1|nr:hypothetical protein BOTBODRAFT_133128 [Botryobasidium botryosum FD-172 SS1]
MDSADITRCTSLEDPEKVPEKSTALEAPPGTIFGELPTDKDLANPRSPAYVSPKGVRRFVIVYTLCSAQFFDVFNAVSAITALPPLGADLGFSPGALQWVLSAYSLTFAAFMITAGRLSDIYHPKPIFCAGYAIVGITSILCAVSVHPIMLLVFRAIMGIGAAMTIPSAISMIVTTFPDPKEQGTALAEFAALGAIGNVIGFVIGGVLTAQVSWRWVFWISAILVLPFSALAFFVLPKHSLPTDGEKRQLDWVGVTILTGGLILFVYAISDANDVGWGNPRIIVTLIMSVVFMVAFFVSQRIVKDPVVPPKIWFNKNFTPLFIFTWSIYWFLMVLELQMALIFQDIFGWSALSAAVHCIPIGVSAGVGCIIAPYLVAHVPRRHLLLAGQLLMSTAAILFALADSPEKYWSHVFPGMIVGMCGTAIGYVGANIAIMADAPPGEEGVVGAMMNTAFQLGATIGIAVSTAITLGVNKDVEYSGNPSDQFKGYSASFWSVLGMNAIMIVNALFFVK